MPPHLGDKSLLRARAYWLIGLGFLLALASGGLFYEEAERHSKLEEAHYTKGQGPPLPLSRSTVQDLDRPTAQWGADDPDEKCPGSREKTGQAKFREYVVRTYRFPNPEGCFEILRNGAQVYAEIGIKFQIGGSPEFEDEPHKLIPIGTDVTGRGAPELVVGEWTGGAHCCFVFYVFEIGEQFRKLAELDTEDSGDARFEDLDGDGRLELLAYDWTFAYWHTSFADSPAPAVILRYRNGAFHFAAHLMRKPAPSLAELQTRAQNLRTHPEWNRPEDPPGALWRQMLDLIYTGNAPLAWQFFEMAWPPERQRKAEFLREFRAKLLESPYWKEIKSLNGGRLW